MQPIGARLRARRQAIGWTIRQLAEHSGLSERYVLMAEQGKANLSLDKLAHLADALDLSMAWLVSDPGRRPLDGLLADRTPDEIAEITAWVLDRFGSGDRLNGGLVALLGLRGAGKSSVGPCVADRLGVAFVELDARVELAADLTLGEIFDLHGEDYYRRVERDVLVALIASGEPAVVATGGSIVTHPDNYDRLRASARTIWLRARAEDHWNRVLQQGDRRPMRDHAHAMADLRALLDAREPLYARADVTVDTSGRRLDGVVAEVVDALAPRSAPQ